MQFKRLAKWQSTFMRVIACCYLADVTAVTCAQPGGSIEEGKQHYNSAVVAIAKSDWFTAKSELLQAEKVAPQNALVHYDLAVVYSRTREYSAAERELRQAQQLGLPPEQANEATALTKQISGSASAEGKKKRGDGEVWLRCAIDSGVIAVDGSTTPWKQLEVFVWKPASKELWEYDDTDQKLISQIDNPGYEVGDENIQIAFVPSKYDSGADWNQGISRSSLKYWYTKTFVSSGRVTIIGGEGACQKIPPKEIGSKPKI